MAILNGFLDSFRAAYLPKRLLALRCVDDLREPFRFDGLRKIVVLVIVILPGHEAALGVRGVIGPVIDERSSECDGIAYPVLDIRYEETDILDVVAGFEVEDIEVDEGVQECLEDDGLVPVCELLGGMDEDVLEFIGIPDGEF